MGYGDQLVRPIEQPQTVGYRVVQPVPEPRCSGVDDLDRPQGAVVQPFNPGQPALGLAVADRRSSTKPIRIRTSLPPRSGLVRSAAEEVAK